jgi:hypothetical protein
VLFVRVLSRRVIVPSMRVEIIACASGIRTALHAHRGTGGFVRVLFIAAQQLVQPTHGGSSSSSGYAAVYVSLNAKSGEPEGLPDLARAEYWPNLPAVKDANGENGRKEQTFFLRYRVGAHTCEHMFYDGRSLD